MPNHSRRENLSTEVHKIAIVGSRTGVNPEAVYKLVDKLDPVTSVVISGGAAGADTFAAERARQRGIRVVEIRPNWKKYGKQAGFIRNKEIVLAADEVAAFWDGESRGTFDTMRKARKYARPLALFDGEGTLIEFNPNHVAVRRMYMIKTRNAA